MLFVTRGRMLIGVAVVVSLLVFGIAGCGSESPETVAPPAPDVSEPTAPDTGGEAEEPAGDGDRALVESKCSGCHALDRVWAASKDRAQWETTVRRMEANGLQVTEDERLTIITYLAEQ